MEHSWIFFKVPKRKRESAQKINRIRSENFPRNTAQGILRNTLGISIFGLGQGLKP
jgi:hypothetical protein